MIDENEGYEYLSDCPDTVNELVQMYLAHKAEKERLATELLAMIEIELLCFELEYYINI